MKLFPVFNNCSKDCKIAGSIDGIFSILGFCLGLLGPNRDFIIVFVI